MIILSNIAKLYDGTGADDGALHTGVDLWIEDGRIHDLLPHAGAPVVGPDHTVVDASA